MKLLSPLCPNCGADYSHLEICLPTWYALDDEGELGPVSSVDVEAEGEVLCAWCDDRCTWRLLQGTQKESSTWRVCQVPGCDRATVYSYACGAGPECVSPQGGPRCKLGVFRTRAELVALRGWDWYLGPRPEKAKSPSEGAPGPNG